MENEEIRKRLFELADKKYQEFHSGLCPNTDNIIGVRIPVLRKFAKEIVKTEDIKLYLNKASNEFYEEIMLQGMVIGLARMGIEDTISHIKTFVPKIDNWAICDVFCAELKIVKKNPEIFWEFIQKYLEEKAEFSVRFGIVMLLDYYITEKYIVSILELMDKIKHEGYYVKMAVAWLLSIAYIKFPDKTMPYLKENNLDNFTYQKALQKIVESYRVSDQKKEEIRKMKKESRKSI